MKNNQEMLEHNRILCEVIEIRKKVRKQLTPSPHHILAHTCKYIILSK